MRTKKFLKKLHLFDAGLGIVMIIAAIAAATMFFYKWKHGRAL